MNENKMRRLLDAARSEPLAQPGPDFAAQAMRAVRQAPESEPVSVLGQLGDLFPRLAVAAALVIGLCVAADFCAAAVDQSDLTSGVAQLSDQWLFATRGF
jgi:hypothetical protein